MNKLIEKFTPMAEKMQAVFDKHCDKYTETLEFSIRNNNIDPYLEVLIEEQDENGHREIFYLNEINFTLNEIPLGKLKVTLNFKAREMRIKLSSKSL
jgi:hypothetical protein